MTPPHLLAMLAMCLLACFPFLVIFSSSPSITRLLSVFLCEPITVLTHVSLAVNFIYFLLSPFAVSEERQGLRFRVYSSSYNMYSSLSRAIAGAYTEIIQSPTCEACDV